MDISKIKIIMFDTLGTVMDWHGSIVEAGKCLGRKYGFTLDWGSFANSWRVEVFINTVNEVAQGVRTWEKIDVINKRKLIELLEQYRITIISNQDIEQLNMIWHRLRPWCDSLPGLLQLNKKYKIGSFSNGDFRMLLDMAKYWNLPWDFLISGEMFKKFKPDPSIYVDAINLLGGKPEEILMVATHLDDLDGAFEAGCSTIYVPRPFEWGKNSNPVGTTAKHSHMVVPDFISLAKILGTC